MTLTIYKLYEGVDPAPHMVDRELAVKKGHDGRVCLLYKDSDKKVHVLTKSKLFIWTIKILLNISYNRMFGDREELMTEAKDNMFDVCMNCGCDVHGYISTQKCVFCESELSNTYEYKFYHRKINKGFGVYADSRKAIAYTICMFTLIILTFFIVGIALGVAVFG